ncbi:hypothetical protein [Planococcus donghaensis]|uniref:YtkA-like domain-containing protein n=1 Tax=Planococcus donghaensis TaxID=414778 RepID=A0A1C7EF91_9BACL|nr:hypothetical protein [Planococcus donghaensis]ANU22052.1 hypothetical protein BCM40_01290 [Planococcus donghaensis]
MKKKLQLIVFLTLLLSGCTYADTMLKPPELVWNVPENIEVDQNVDIDISLQSEATEKLQAVSFVLQKQGDQEMKNIPFSQDEEGNVKIQTKFAEDGIYNLYSTMQTTDQTIKPIRQIVVGEMAETNDEKGESEESKSSSHH